jgi:hypothetical protein
MRSGGKGVWDRGPALYKHNYNKKVFQRTCRGTGHPRIEAALQSWAP